MERREALKRGGAVAAGMALFPTGFAERLARLAPQEAVVPWTNAPPAGGRANTLDWQALTSWVTPTDELFSVGHYGTPEIDATTWALEVGGLVDRPLRLTLDQIRSRPSRDVTCLIECAGNRGFATFMGAVHNATWTGTPLAGVLSEAGLQDEGIEVVFFGADEGTETIREIEVTQNFARSLSVADAMADEVTKLDKELAERDDASDDIEVIDWAQEDRDQLREVARKEWEAYAEKSDLAQEALDAHISYMTEIGLFKE